MFLNKVPKSDWTSQLLKSLLHLLISNLPSLPPPRDPSGYRLSMSDSLAVKMGTILPTLVFFKGLVRN